MIKSLPDEELKKLADDIYRGDIFTSNHIQRNEDVGSVFIPLIMANEDVLKSIENVGMIYEYMSHALPIGINGMPCFSSMRFLNIEDTKKVDEYYKKIKAAVDGVELE